MRFTVIWDPPALGELADIWMRSVNRDSVTSAAATTDRDLAEDAHLKGDDFYGSRLAIIGPLFVVYTVSLDDRLVRIRLVWAMN